MSLTTAPTSSFVLRTSYLARDIKLSHTIFAMPFALLATFLAAAYELPAGRGGVANSLAFDGSLPSPLALGLIILCMVFARTFAMAVNRLADARYDAQNPRTAGRAIPAGRLSRSYMLAVLALCAAGFLVATAAFWFFFANPFPLALSPLVLAWLALYSYTKRFTWLCHLFLGSALAMSPIAAAIAIQPAFILQPEPWLLMVIVTCWVAGFDIIYALQDVDFDRSARLHSMPANLGVEPALWIARLLHVGALVALGTLVWLSALLGITFASGIVIVAALLLLEHALVWGSRTHHISMAFFTVNGLISVLLGGLGILEVILSRS
ncbi:MAG: UbiA-like polyprenyltransferase [Phycisphaeraceae bacterium]